MTNSIHSSFAMTQEVVHTTERETKARGETINPAAIAARSAFDEALKTASDAAFAYEAVRGNGTPAADAAWKASKTASDLLGKAKIACINAYDNC